MNLRKGLLIMCCLGLLMGMVGCAEKEVQGGKEIDTDVNKPNADKDKDAYVFVSEGNSAYRLNPQTGGADKEADALREAIMNATDDLDTSGGTVYYISSLSGDDKNEGTSPEKAWCTLSAYTKNKKLLKAGDTVLFERGGVYRGGDNVPLISGVTYGAYGSGAKPAIYGSRKNYSGEGSWKKTDMENVWVCNEYVVSDVGVIVFNHGQAVGIKRLGEGETLEENLAELQANFEFYHDLGNAKLYLYLDHDPSETFYDIEICEKGNILKGASGCKDVTIDNLSIKYGGGHAIRFDENASHIVITNCEIGFMGGSIQNGTTRYGNGIEFWNGCSDILVENNWIYQIYDAGFTHQGGDVGGYVQEDITLRSNLVEYCCYSLEFYVGNSAEDLMKNVLYEGNIVRFAGYGWGMVRPDPMAVGAINAWGFQDAFRTENFVIKDNIFDMSARSLIVQYYKEGLDITYTGNSYYLKEGNVAIWKGQELLTAEDQKTMEESVAVIDKNPKTVQFIQQQ